jgi:hypothetical protein
MMVIIMVLMVMVMVMVTVVMLTGADAQRRHVDGHMHQGEDGESEHGGDALHHTAPVHLAEVEDGEDQCRVGGLREWEQPAVTPRRLQADPGRQQDQVEGGQEAHEVEGGEERQTRQPLCDA